MADISISKSRGKKYLGGASPMVPAFIVGDDPIPLNPPGSVPTTLFKLLGDVTDKDFIGKNGFVPVVNGEDLLTLQPLPQLQENGLISGGIVQWTGIGYIFNVSGAFYRIGGISYESPPIQITLATPDVTNNRIDVFAVNSSGVALAITGTPSGSPVKPQINPQTQLELTSVIVTASTTVPTLTEDVIYDENTEWTGSTTGTGTVAFNSTVDPFQGTVSINATNIQNGLKIRLTDGSDYDLSTVQTLGLQINLKATMGAGLNIGVTFLNSSGSPISTELILNHNKTLLGYQFVGIALSQFSFTSFLARSIEFRYIRTKGTIIYSGFFLDIIKLEGGINPPQTVGSFLGLSDTPTSYSGQAGKSVAVKADESGLEFVTVGGGGISGSGTTNEIAYFTGASAIASLPLATYPSLTELSYVKGVTSSVQTQINGKQPTIAGTLTDTYVATIVAGVPTWQASSGASNWTAGTGFIYRNGPVVIGDTVWSNSTALTVKGNSTASSWVLKVQDSAGSNLIALLNDKRLWLYSDIINLGNNPSGANGVTLKTFTTTSVNAFSIQDSTGSTLLSILADGQAALKTNRFNIGSSTTSATTGVTIKVPGTGFTKGLEIQDSSQNVMTNLYANGSIVTIGTRNGFGIVSGIITNGSHFQGVGTSTSEIFVVQNGSAQRAFEIRGNRQIIMAGLPTSNPGVTGSLWNNAGVLNIA